MKPGACASGPASSNIGDATQPMNGYIIMKSPKQATPRDLHRSKPRWQAQWLSAKWWTPVRKVSASAVVILGVVTGLLNFLPRVTVDMAASVNKKNPVALSVIVRNTGYIPLNNVRIQMGLCVLDLGRINLVGEGYDKITKTCQRPLETRFFLYDHDWTADNLVVDRSMGINIGDLWGFGPGFELKKGDISIVIEYYPWLLPIKLEREFSYRANIQDTDAVVWLPISR